jgi:hypothetical protein
MRIGRALLLGALLLVAAAGVRPPIRADEPNQAGLVAQLSSGEVVTRCIAFEEDEISGAELLTRSGLEVVIDPASFMGVTVCRIEGVGCDHPAEPCFCQCMGGGTCTYWNYYFREPGAAEWTTGDRRRCKVRPGSVGRGYGAGDRAPPAA